MTTQRHCLGIICEVLLIIGAINWGLVGLFDFNLVHSLFFSYPLLEKTIYGVVGVAGLYILYRLLQKERRSLT